VIEENVVGADVLGDPVEGIVNLLGVRDVGFNEVGGAAASPD
jgi:hypothetical protein